MSLPNCLPDLIASGKIRKADAEAANRAYQRHYNRLLGEMGPDAAAAEASERALAELEHEAMLKKRQAGLTIKAQQRMDADMAKGVAAGKRPHRVLINMVRDVIIASDRIERQAHDFMHGFIERHRRNLIGRPQDKTGLLDFVRERHGQSTGNATAKVLSDAVGQSFEWLRLRFNRNGGDIGFRSDFGLPHQYDAMRVRLAGREQFRTRFLEELAPERMVDPLTGGAFTPERLSEFIDAAFDNIRSNGLSGEGGGNGARSLANRRSDPRFFVFKDGDAWLRIAKDFGSGNPFEQVLSHIHGMSRDIAMMERFGPNPAASWRRGMDQADRGVATGPEGNAQIVTGTSRSKRRAEKLWDYMTGDLTVPILPDGDGFLAKAGRFGLNALHGTRDVITSAFLGGAQLTSIADLNTQFFARRINALPVTSMIGGYLKQLNPLDATDRRRAIYLLGGMRDATRSMMSIARYYGETHGPRWSQVLADGTLRVTGLNKFFEAGHRLFIDDYAKQMALERGLAFDQLPEGRREAFERHGITPEDWDVIRSAETYKEGRIEWVDWHRVGEADSQVSDRMLDMLLKEARSAVIEADAETHAMLRFDRPGSAAGEIGANTLQFKSFTVALMMDQARRVGEIAERKGGAAAAKYAASFVVGMTLFGAATIQLRELAKGKDMRPMFREDGLPDPEFWVEALAQSGGLGIFSDLIGTITEERVDGLVKLAAGPVVQAADDALQLGKSFIPDENGETKAGREVTRFARRYTPGTTIWYLRAALDRLVWDELGERLDPDYWRQRERLEESAAEAGQGYYWRPGEPRPDRLPALPRERPVQ